MDTVRYVLAVVVWATVLPAVFYWYLIHPFVGYWRSVGPTRTYLVVIPFTLLLMGALLRWRGPVAASDLGENWAVFYSGLVLYCAAILLEREIRKQLDFRTLAGVPELQPVPPEGAEAGSPKDPMLTEGIYARLRHPRYGAVFLGTFGVSLMSNHGAAYAVTAALIPSIWGLVRLEDRELVQRFGDAYRVYRDRVPALIPRHGPRND